MNAEELIDEVIDVVDDPDYADRDVILKYINQSVVNISNFTLLPELSSGFSTIITAPGLHTVPVPDNYHKSLYLAQVDGNSIGVFASLKELSLSKGGISDDVGDVTAITAGSGGVTYQGIPDVPISIDIFYYRKPVDMTDSASSTPDGMSGNDDFDWSIIHLACQKIFNKIEDGMDGAKVNTDNHAGLAVERMLAVDQFAVASGKNFTERPLFHATWPEC